MFAVDRGLSSKQQQQQQQQRQRKGRVSNHIKNPNNNASTYLYIVVSKHNVKAIHLL